MKKEDEDRLYEANKEVRLWELDTQMWEAREQGDFAAYWQLNLNRRLLALLPARKLDKPR